MNERIIIVDDDQEFGKILQRMSIDVLKYRADFTSDPEQFIEMIQKAEDDGDPYQVATLDMNFNVRGASYEFQLGHKLLADVKQRFPYLKCIMISGSGKTPSEVLRLRDEYDLDWFIQKDRYEPGNFKTAVEHVLKNRNNAAPPVTDSGSTQQPTEPICQAFISYRRRNAWGKARAIKNSLAEHNVDAFLDVDNIGGGDFPPYIIKSIVERPYFILLLAPDTLESEWVRKEVSYALDAGNTIIPLLFDDFQLIPENIPADLNGLLTKNAITMTPQTYAGDIDRLLRLLTSET